MDNKLIPLNKDYNDKQNFTIYKKLEEYMKGLKCGNSDEIKYMNEYLCSLKNVHWKLLEDVQDKTGKETKPHICSEGNCKSINNTLKSTKKQLGLKAIILRQSNICSNLIPRHFKLLLTLKKNKDKLNDNNTDLYQHILTNFFDLLIKLGLIKYARCLNRNHPRVQEKGPNEGLYGGKKTKKQTPLQKLKLKHRNQLNNLKNKQKNDVLKLKSKHQKDLKKLCT